MKKVLHAISRAFYSVVQLISSPKFQQYEQFVLSVVAGIQTVAPNKTTAEVIKAYASYGVPISTALADGKLTEDELKSALGFLAAKVVERKFPSVSTTQANLLINAAYEQIKLGVR